jgi:anti-sigma regulatory factor (Ser/Thr protein kinase)
MTAESHTMVPCLSQEVPAVPASVAQVRQGIRAFAAANGADERALASIVLAVSEAAANAVVHAYRGREVGPVRVDADVEEGTIEVVVADDGGGFTDAPVRGLGFGLAFMRERALAFEVRDRPTGGVEVWMRFRLAG